MRTPLQEWLENNRIKRRELARAAGVSWALVQHATTGDAPLRGQLRRYLESVAPGLPDRQDAAEEIGRATDRHRIAERVA